MSVTSKTKLLSKLENSKAYREAYVNEHVKTSVPLQIHHLREQRALTQTQLAELARMTQTVISRLEDPNYGNLTLNSLLKIAAAFDIGLLVKFVPFSRLIREFQDLSPTALSVQSFPDDIAVLEAHVQATPIRLRIKNDAAIDVYTQIPKWQYQLEQRSPTTFVIPSMTSVLNLAAGIGRGMTESISGRLPLSVPPPPIPAENGRNRTRAGVVETASCLVA